MQLKHTKSLFNTVLIVIVMVIILLPTVNKQQYVIAKEDLAQKLTSLNLGFSHFRTLIDTGEGEREFSIYEKTMAIISSIPKVIKYKLFNESEFERIDIRINFLDYSTLMEDRKRAIRDNILSNPTKVKAVLKLNGKKYKAKLRLKGDLHHHWDSKYRMSLRVELKNNKNILGFSSFSIQKPRERKHPYDYAFQSMVRDTGNLASVHKFAHVFVNGEDWGIMDIEEHMSKEFIEKQNKKNTIIFRFSNEDKWLYTFTSKIPYDGYRLSDPRLFIRLYNKKSLKDIFNRKAYSYISNNTLSNNMNLYDVDSFSKALITTLAWNNTHTIADSNSRYYFNPYTLKIEPITADQGRWWVNKGIDHLELNNKYLSILSSQSFKDRLPENLKKVSQIVLNIDEYLSFNESLFPVDRIKNTIFVKNHMRKIIDNQKEYLIYPIKKRDIENRLNNKSADIEQQEQPTRQQASEFPEHLYIRHYTDGTLEIYNLIPDAVTVKDVLFNGKSISIDDTVVPSYLSHPEPTVIKTLYKGIQDEMFTVSTQYQGFDRISKNNITLISGEIDNPLLFDTTNEFDFINKLDRNTYEIEQGNWVVNKPIIVGGDLHISPGANLQFSEDAYIIVKGSLIAIGGKENPIIFKAISDSWKGIYVLNADKKSHLKNVNISNLSALEDGLLKLTGGITFYKSDVDFENVKINDVKAEDALNIVESEFYLNSIYVNNTISDGLDSDFSKGSVLNSEFSDIGGDALDFSGSNVLIGKTEANNIKDKAVSAGEKSILTVKDSKFNNIGVGIASKDGSSVTVTGAKILNYKLYGAMAYLKKDFYDMPNLTISNSTVSEGRAYIRQKGTSMTVDGIDIPETKISVKKLYKTKVMAK
jgi:hypothetical protein